MGFKTQTPFKGSLNYCGKEMIDLYNSGDIGFVDVYFNDCASLKQVEIDLKSLTKFD